VADVIDTATIRIAPLTRVQAQDLATWRYDPPYDVYDLAGADPEELLDPALGFHAVLAGERLIGFRSFGPDGQVPGQVGSFAALRDGRRFDVLVRAEGPQT
jgi:ribosomal-protein-alanine N-acetyltransferase